MEEAEHLFDDASMRKAADIARAAGAVGIHDVREGGIFGGLWELAAAGGVGLDVELKRIPVRQHTIEVCEFFRLNPYMLISGGTLLIVCENGERVAAALAKEGDSGGGSSDRPQTGMTGSSAMTMRFGIWNPQKKMNITQQFSHASARLNCCESLKQPCVRERGMHVERVLS